MTSEMAYVCFWTTLCLFLDDLTTLSVFSMPKKGVPNTATRAFSFVSPKSLNYETC